MATILAGVTLFALLVVGMSIGIILSERTLKGTCGGEPARGPDGLPMICGACPKGSDVCPTDNPLLRSPWWVTRHTSGTLSPPATCRYGRPYLARTLL